MLPLPSRTVQITVLVPTGNVAGALFVTVTAPQLSAVVGTPRFTFVATQRPAAVATVTRAGHPSVGGSGSVTVTVNWHVLVLPLASTAVFVTVVTPTGNALPLVRLLVTFVTPQLSLALTVNCTLLRLHRPASALNTRFVGHMSVGGCASRTITSCTQFAVLLLPSHAVHTTTFVPTGKVVGALFVTVTVPQLSAVTGRPKFTFVAAHNPAAAFTVTLLGHTNVGGSASVTVTVNVQLAVFPLASVAVFVTVVVPTGNVLPLATLLVTFVTPQLSLAFTVNTTLLRLHRPASVLNTRFVGHVSTGFCVSVTVTVNRHVLVFPLASTAVFVTVVTPTGNVLPLAGTLSRLASPQLSLALTVKVTLLRLHRPASTVNTKLLGHVITGG